MAEKIISLGDGPVGIMTYNKPKCEKAEDHDWSGDGIIHFHNDERVMTSTEYCALPEEEKERLNVYSEQVSCKHCGIGYMEYDNPFYHDI